MTVLVAGGLFMVKDHGFEQPLRTAVGVAAALVTVAVFVIGGHRRRVLAARPLAEQLTARREVLGAGAGVVTLAVLVVAYLALPLF
ncbi:hypothetical protein [Mycolicibacterium sp. F2034L]|uniref:hypothetical protein n=1 Tax=Mycolicibacterium sp. F2034L TaxID=2926422 RepID=UPI001FF35CC7|nr:hypothetical protein [Mycolicibacterium sp. F2034L]MCK0177601.1 hypothetical protein [Mycolicibacterium sp. F2034L]